MIHEPRSAELKQSIKRAPAEGVLRREERNMGNTGTKTGEREIERKGRSNQKLKVVTLRKRT